MKGKSPEVAPKLTLKFGQQKSANREGISVDNEALKRQQELVKAGINGGNPTPNASRPQIERNSSSSTNTAVVNGIKREASHASSPALAPGLVNGLGGPAMAPPLHLTHRIPSGSPHPQAVAPPNVVPPPPAYSSSNFNSQWRPAGKGNESSDNPQLN